MDNEVKMYDIEKIVSTLIASLKDSDPKVRMHACAALCKFGHNALDAIPTLISLTKDEDKKVRSAAIVALGDIRPKISKRSRLPARTKVRKHPKVPFNEYPHSSLSLEDDDTDDISEYGIYDIPDDVPRCDFCGGPTSEPNVVDIGGCTGLVSLCKICYEKLN